MNHRSNYLFCPYSANPYIKHTHSLHDDDMVLVKKSYIQHLENQIQKFNQSKSSISNKNTEFINKDIFDDMEKLFNITKIADNIISKEEKNIPIKTEQQSITTLGEIIERLNKLEQLLLK